jgi:hypothetical protein
MENNLIEKWTKDIVQKINITDSEKLSQIKNYLLSEDRTKENFNPYNIPLFVAAMLQKSYDFHFLNDQEIDDLIEKTNFNAQNDKNWTTTMYLFLYLDIQTLLKTEQIEKIIHKTNWKLENDLKQNAFMIYFSNKNFILLKKHIHQIMNKINIEQKDYSNKNIVFYALKKHQQINEQDWNLLLQTLQGDDIYTFAIETVKNEKTYYLLDKMIDLKKDINYKNKLAFYLLLNQTSESNELLKKLIVEKKITVNFNLKNMIKKFNEPLWEIIKIMNLQKDLSKKLKIKKTKVENYKL